jgi:hypothetical protein
MFQLRVIALLFFTGALINGCHWNGTPSSPSLEISHVPPASAGGPEQMASIDGRVNGARAGQQIVVYAKNGVWWVQPFKSRPFTAIQSDATWKSSIHLGAEYAALLVDSGYQPQPRMDALPPRGNGVIAITTAKGGSPATPTARVIHFSGYDWTVRAAASERGGEMNAFDPGNAWVDDKGRLHLQMGMKNGRWACAEVNLTRSLGYGTYRFVVQDSAHLDPSSVVGMFTVDEHRAEDIHAELDIELSRWGRAESKNAQYVVQPYYVPENISRFEVASGEATYILHWEPGSASFKSVPGASAGPGATVLSEHTFTSGIPVAAAETVHINLYDFYHSRSSEHIPQEVVIEKFEYLP